MLKKANSQQSHTDDVEMEDSSSGGFKKAGAYMSGRKETGDFSFLKKKVRVNVVDKDVQEYHLD